MKYLVYVFMMMIAFGCDKEVEMVEDDGDKINNVDCDFDFGKFTLDPSSLLFNRYVEGNKVYFVDSLQNTLILNVIKVYRWTHTGFRTRFDYPAPGDTIRYCYRPDVLVTILETDDKTIGLRQMIETQITGPVFSPTNFSDFISIFSSYPSGINKITSVFHDLINVRTSDCQPFYAEILSAYTVFGRTFKNVRFTEYYNQKVRLWFNPTEGIVAFTDESDKLWRFDRVE